MDIVYLNGCFLPIAQAKVSVLDRGFLFADGVYEVIPVYQGKPFLLDEHLVRLTGSLEGIELKLDKSAAALKAIIHKLLDKNQATQANVLVYLHVTRGVEGERSHIYGDSPKPTLFIKLMLPSTKNYEDGIKIITEPDTRGEQCDIKDIAKLYHAISLKKAKAKGASEVVYVREGNITEGASGNVFGVKDGVVYTPPKSKAVLPGITRDKIIALLQENKVPIKEQAITLMQFFEMDEIWMSASGKEIVKVMQVDEKIILHQRAPLYTKIVKWYKRAIEL